MAVYIGGAEDNDYVFTVNDGNNYVDGGAGDDSLTISMPDATPYSVTMFGNRIQYAQGYYEGGLTWFPQGVYLDYVNIETINVNFGPENDYFVVSGETITATVDGGAGYDDIYFDNRYKTSGATFVYDPGSDGLLTFDGISFRNFESFRYFGGSGDDVITVVGNVRAEIYGTSGNDILTGGTADDRLYGDQYGNAGNDILDGGAGADLMDGGAGNDIYYVDNVGDTIYEGAGIDEVRTTLAEYSLSADLENLVGLGLGGGQLLRGNAGANRIIGGFGDDSIFGGDGDDTIEGSTGNDVLRGGNGTDSLSYEHAAGGVTVSLAQQSAGPVDTGGAGSDDFSGFENIRGSAFDDVLTGDNGVNVLSGLNGADTMIGLNGGDIYYVDNVGDRVIEAPAPGYDIIMSAVSYALPANVEAIELLGRARIDATGNGLDNRLTGNSAANRLIGGAGADVMIGRAGDDVYYVDDVGDVVIENDGEGNDRIFSSVSYSLNGRYVETLRLLGSGDINATGNQQANILIGNRGDNLIRGAGGNDVLTGGDGKDIFAFDTALSAENIDVITDFVLADDTIRLSQSVFTALNAGGALNAGAFRIGATSLDSDDRILYDSATGNLFYDSDGNRARDPVLFAQLAAGLEMTAADFVIV